MKKVLTFSEFLAEGAAVVSPHIKIAKNIAATVNKVAALKKAIVEAPEKRVITTAKIQVELEKVDALQAQKTLLSAQDFEEQRAEREKVAKLRDKVASANKKVAKKK